MSTPGKTDAPAANPFAAFGTLAGGPLQFGAGAGSTSFSFNASTFGGLDNTKKDNTPKKDEDEDDDDGDDDDDEAGAIDESHAADFKPIVTLEKVEVKSSEEDEDVLFKSRSKLYVFVKEDKYGDEIRTNWWRERGLGDIKILKHKVTNECRVVMRQEKTLKVCLNHKISPLTELKSQPGTDKAWTFPAVDFADGEAKTDLFALRLPSAEVAQDFQARYEEAKNFNKAKQSAAASPAKAAETSSAAPTPSKSEAAAPAAKTSVPETPAASSSAVATKPTTPSVESIANQVKDLKAPSDNQPVRLGGYQKRSPDETDVKKIADFAVGHIGQGQLVKIASVKSQVVAGMNYRMALHIRNAAGEIYAHVVTVYQPLPHTKQPLSVTDHVTTGRVV